MAKMLEGKPAAPKSSVARFTHVWAGDPDEARRLAESCFIEHVAATPQELVAQVDAVMVMDEVIEARARLLRPFLEAGKAAFVDKTLSLDATVSDELLQLAAERQAPLAAYSQLRFAPGFAEVGTLAGGGLASASFRMSRDILAKYSIHLVSAVQGVFGVGICRAEKLACPEEGVEVRATYKDGTRVTLHFGPDAPPGGNLCYLAPDGCRCAAAGDNHGMFESSAAAIEIMLRDGESPVSLAEMREASRLIAFIVDADVGATEELV
jgi:hypothetical protein